ncbi:hypothetical protein [Bradyrhizobium mercantei]|uniref:hypothetical protein n=1 Tax=Bradyrhizobium mercantei TaxID=1904807 RepID=UPI00097803EE|nr:hypothetical protein [Bradyrhizobium mercantei]
MTLQAGDWVEVRSKEEILRSLDRNGRLEGMPFMPQMLEYCGRRFKVYKRAHKTCDTINPIAGRRLANSVHLETRCNGKAYGGCQAECLIFWKEAWLKPIEEKASSNHVSSDRNALELEAQINGIGCSADDVWQATCVRGRQDDDTRYMCQATELPVFTTPLSWWDVRQYMEDYVSGNVSLGTILRGFAYLSYYHLTLAKRGRLGRPARWLYDKVQGRVGGVPFPRRSGSLAGGQPTPVVDLNLQPGELVRIKSHKEILSTLNGSMNRGLLFEAELVPYCGGVYRVRTRVTKFINEATGKMSTMKTPAVILDGVWCRSRYANCRMFCPRSIYSWWREAWLERVSEEPAVEMKCGAKN